MKQLPGEYLADVEDQGSTMAMDVDDVEPLEILAAAESLLTHESINLADADFFNSFADDFDDTDIY